MADERKPSESSRYFSEVGESVPALEVPLSTSQCHEDELLSWLQYPLEDSFDKNYCSDEPYPDGAESRSDIVHTAFSNLTLRGATYTWGIPGVADTAKGERILAANMAMAMGAQRAAGLLSQSGADTFNKVRTNAQPHAAKSIHNHVTKETSGSASGVHKVEKLGLMFPNVTRPNFSLFSRTGGPTGKSSEQASPKATQKAKLGFIRHAGGSSDNQTARVITSNLQSRALFFKNAVQSSTALDTSMIIKEFPSMSLLPSRATEDTDMCFPVLPSGTSNEFFKETHITDGAEFTTRPLVSSELGAKAIGLTTHTTVNSRALAFPHRRGGLLTQLAPAAAATSRALGASAGSSCKRIRPETETKQLVSQENPSASTVVTDTDSLRLSKLARHASDTTCNLVGSPIFFSTTELESNLYALRTDSGITMDSQLPKTTGMGDAFTQSSSRARGDSISKSVTEAAAFSAKRKSPFSEKSEYESKVFKDGNLLQGGVIQAKGTQPADIQTFKRDTCNRYITKCWHA